MMRRSKRRVAIIGVARSEEMKLLILGGNGLPGLCPSTTRGCPRRTRQTNRDEKKPLLSPCERQRLFPNKRLEITLTAIVDDGTEDPEDHCSTLPFGLIRDCLSGGPSAMKYPSLLRRPEKDYRSGRSAGTHYR